MSAMLTSGEINNGDADTAQAPASQQRVLQPATTAEEPKTQHPQYKHHAALVCAAMQIFLGVASVSLNLTSIVNDNAYFSGIGLGIWTPALVS